FEGKKINPGDKIQKTSVIDLVLGDGNGGLNREEVQEVQEELDVNSNTTEENGEN
ncbi:MAG TPA: serine/threonine protein kinase, partial [Flavobacteriaceae bacterium]|nr:serine/threonine protein kinase [Flavobacteriaceae bacterium]